MRYDPDAAEYGKNDPDAVLHLRGCPASAILDQERKDKDMFPMKEFERRYREILDAMDAVLDDGAVSEADGEDLEELNAEAEDAMMMFTEIDPESEDWMDEAADALEEFEALNEDYLALAKRIPDIAPLAHRMKMLTGMLAGNMTKE